MSTCGTVTVEEQQQGPNIGLQSCQTSPGSGSTVGPNQTITVSATVQNSGDESGSVTISFSAAGQQFGSQTVTVPAGESRQASASFTPSELGLSGSVSTAVSLSQGSTAGLRRLADGGREFGLSRLDRRCSSCGG